jgi:iron complex transport system permease protein
LTSAALTRSPARPAGLLGVGVVVSLVLLVLAATASVALGARDVAPGTLLRALTDPTPDADLVVLRDMRLPRTALGLLAGAALGLGGALLQGLTRNPLADPGIMGVNAGASLAVVAAASVAGGLPVGGLVWFAFAGAGAATVVVFLVASAGRNGATPVALALAGAAVSALAASVVSAVELADPDALEELRRWSVGSLAGRYAPVLGQLWPYLLAGVLLAPLAARALNALALGDETARALGVRLGRTRALLFALVTLLCGAATAACGPIAFLGLMVPHLARLVCGPDHRWILVYSGLLGAVVLVGCDVAGRLLLPVGEVPVGLVVGVLGAPVFVAIVSSRRALTL